MNPGSLGLAEMLSRALQVSNPGSQLQIQGPWYPHNTGSLLESLPLNTISWLISVIFLLFPWRRKWQPTPVFLPGESHGWRGLVGYSPRVAKSWTQLNDFTFFLSIVLLEKEMAAHSSVLAWRIPWMEGPSGLQSTELQRVGCD